MQVVHWLLIYIFVQGRGIKVHDERHTMLAETNLCSFHVYAFSRNPI
jgi:hypothetical protein